MNGQKQSSLFGPFVSHTENEVFCKWPLVKPSPSYQILDLDGSILQRPTDSSGKSGCKLVL